MRSFVVEDEHPDASGFPVARKQEPDRSRAGRGFAERTDDGFELAARPVTEKRERDVQMLSRNGSDVPQVLSLPVLDLVEDVVGQA